MAVAELQTGTEALIEIAHVTKDYTSGAGIVRALKELNLTIMRGEFVAIVGTSGSGKSTLMNLIGCLDRPTTGTYTLSQVDVGARTNDGRAIVRNRLIGFIFQGFNLLPRTTALENVELPLSYRGIPRKERRLRAEAALASVGLRDRMDHTPNQLSGGQQQRVAIARALVTDPPLLLADEPTGNLDTRTSLEVLSLLQRLNRDRGITVVLVTHEHDIAACASRVITFRDGRMVSDVAQETPKNAARELELLPLPEVYLAKDAASTENPKTLRARKIGGPVPASVFGFMAIGTATGIVLGVLYNNYFLAGKGILVPLLFALIMEGWFGGSAARRSLGRPLTLDQRVRAAAYYSVATQVLFALPLFISIPEKLRVLVVGGLPGKVAAGFGILLVSTLLLTGLRVLFLTLLAPSPKRMKGEAH